MPISGAAPVPPANRLLAALPSGEYHRLFPHLAPRHLQRGQVLHPPDVPVTRVYFPGGGVISLVLLLPDGKQSEVAMVGQEGMIGLPLFLAAGAARTQAVCQVPGDAVSMEPPRFRQAVRAGRPLDLLLRRYTQAVVDQLAQTAACNQHHAPLARCANWLLLAQERGRVDRLPLTHRALAELLRVRRATITEAMRRLQQAGWIDYARGQVFVRDRAGLETASCGCHARVQEAYERVLGGTDPAPR
jgi:CRP-like cAMP-binding protein